MPTDLVGKKVVVSVLFDTVSIEVICGDDYLAQVLYDDLVERLQSGQGITLALEQPATTVSNGER
jgi:hypothetical protein